MTKEEFVKDLKSGLPSCRLELKGNEVEIRKGEFGCKIKLLDEILDEIGTGGIMCISKIISDAFLKVEYDYYKSFFPIRWS